MVCFSSHNANRVPCTVADRETLVQAGLGEKKISIPDISCSPQEFRNIVVAAFPKLDGCGGFDLLRCIPNTKDLEAISLAVSQSPKLLKSVVGGGKVFIRPIQQDLDLDLDKKLITSVEVCATLRTSTRINLCRTTMIVFVGYGEVHPLQEGGTHAKLTEACAGLQV